MRKLNRRLDVVQGFLSDQQCYLLYWAMHGDISDVTSQRAAGEEIKSRFDAKQIVKK